MTAELDIRPCRDVAELREAMRSIGQYFGSWPSDEQAERWLENFELERMHGAWDEGRIVGGAGAFSFELTVPGRRTLPAAGVTVVGVYPTDRRRGVLRRLMRAQLDDVRERGEPLAALWASEETIYGRFGYGKASHQGEIEVARDRTAFARPLERRGTMRIVPLEEAHDPLSAVYDRIRLSTPGMFARAESWWRERTLADPEERREGAGPKRCVVIELDGRPAGYALYRHKQSWDGGTSTGRLMIIEAVADGPQATAELWRFLFDVDWIASVQAWLLPPDHPIFFLAAEARRLRFRMGDGLWMRLVDVGAALSGRAYAGDGELVLELTDAFCPWNKGRWRLADGAAARTDAEPDLRLDVRALGSAYLGGFTFAELARAGWVEEAREGALARADALFRSDVHPWCPEIF